MEGIQTSNSKQISLCLPLPLIINLVESLVVVDKLSLESEFNRLAPLEPLVTYGTVNQA